MRWMIRLFERKLYLFGDKMSRGIIAKEYFEKGYNCAQSVVLAFADCVSVDKESLAKISSSFGGGFGRLREVCGAFSGMSIIVGLILGYNETNGENKKEHYALIRSLAEEFKNANGGSIICRELLGETEKLSSENPSVRTKEYNAKRPCADIVKSATDILEKVLKEKGVL